MKVFRVLLAVAMLVGTADACTSILVSRGASRDGSVFITYSADGPFMPRLLHLPAADHKPGTMVDAKGWEDPKFFGQVKQVPHTYSVVGLMNEHQLAIGETTTGGREELTDPKGILDYDALILLTLQRARRPGRRSGSSTSWPMSTATTPPARRSRSPTRTRRG